MCMNSTLTCLTESLVIAGVSVKYSHYLKTIYKYILYTEWPQSTLFC